MLKRYLLVVTLVVVSSISAFAANKECLPLDQKAPDFSLKNQDGKVVKLSDFQDKKNVVVYFYPKDNTPICTKESCSFRDAYEGLQNRGAVVIGVSGDSVDAL